MQTVSHTVSNTAQQLERGIKYMVPAEQEPLVDEGKAIIKRYANMPFGTKMESEITKARNMIRNLKDFPSWIDGKVGTQEFLSLFSTKLTKLLFFPPHHIARGQSDQAS